MWTFWWLVHQIISLYEVLKLKQDFRKNKAVAGKTPFYVIGPFCTPHSILLTLASDRTVLYGIDAFSFLVVSTKKQYSSFLKNVFVLQKVWFNVKVLKTFKISSYCYIKTFRSLKRRAFLKIHSTVF